MINEYLWSKICKLKSAELLCSASTTTSVVLCVHRQDMGRKKDQIWSRDDDDGATAGWEVVCWCWCVVSAASVLE